MCGGKNSPSHLFASGFFFDAGPGFLTMTTPEEEEEAVEEDMSTTVRANAALNKDKDSVSSALKSSQVHFSFFALV